MATKSLFGVENDDAASSVQLDLSDDSGNTADYSVNAASVETHEIETTKAFYHIQRTNSGTSKLFINGTEESTSAESSVSLPNQPILICAKMGSSGSAEDFDTHEIGVFGIGGSLTGKESVLNDLYNQYVETIEDLPAGAFLLEDESGFILLENGDLLIKEN